MFDPINEEFLYKKVLDVSASNWDVVRRYNDYEAPKFRNKVYEIILTELDNLTELLVSVDPFSPYKEKKIGHLRTMLNIWRPLADYVADKKLPPEDELFVRKLVIDVKVGELWKERANINATESGAIILPYLKREHECFFQIFNTVTS